MTNETVLERTSNLVMPSHYVELIEEEMAYVEGGFLGWRIITGISSVIVGGIFNIAGIVCSNYGNTTAGTILGIIGTSISTVGGVLLGIPSK